MVVAAGTAADARADQGCSKSYESRIPSTGSAKAIQDLKSPPSIDPSSAPLLSIQRAASYQLVIILEKLSQLVSAGAVGRSVTIAIVGRPTTEPRAENGTYDMISGFMGRNSLRQALSKREFLGARKG